MNLVLKYCTAIMIVLVALSNSSDPPNGRTGAPGDGVCSSCHQGNNFDGTISIENLPTEVVAGQTYSLAVSVNNTDGNAVRAGFQLVSLFNGDFANAGAFTADSDDEGISVLGDRQYIEHRGAKNFQDNVAQWIFEWEAPEVESEREILMFAAGNIANGSGSSGDAIKFTEFQTTVSPAGMDSLIVEIQVENILCNGESADLLAVASGGEGEYTYEWSNGVNTSENNDVLAGFYEVTVTDEVANTAVAEIVLDEPETLVFDFTVMNESSLGADDGSIQTSVTGGTAPYEYFWSGGQVTENLDGLAPGDYTLTVTDANGCMDMITVTVESAQCAFVLNLDFNNITCAGANDGEAIIDPENFEQPISFEWSNGDNAFIAIAGLSPGDYDITVVDGFGCVVIEEFTIVEPSPIEVVTDVIISDCSNPSQNEVAITAEGGTGAYTYLWSSGDTTSSLINAPEGVYSVTITDENGCNTVMDNIVLSYEDNEPPMVTFVDSVEVFVDSLGLIDFSPLNLMESDNCGIESMVLSGDISCDSLGSRVLIYEVVDLNGNVTSEEIYISAVIDTIAPTAICIDDIIQDGCDTIFYDLPEFFDNCGIATVELAEGLPSGSVFPKDSTKVTYNAFDEAGNFFCCSFWVVTSNDLILTIDMIEDATPDDGGSISISTTGGSGSYSYEWILNDTLTVSSFEDVNNLEPGAYTVRVTDESGCVLVSDAILIEMGSSTEYPFIHNVTLYPNPSIHTLSIEHNDILLSAQVMGLDGRIYSTQLVKGTTKSNLDVSNLNAGLYVIRLQFSEGSRTMKFTKI